MTVHTATRLGRLPRPLKSNFGNLQPRCARSSHEGERGAQRVLQGWHAGPTDRRTPEAAAAAPLFVALTRCWLGWRGRGAPGAQLRILVAAERILVCLVRIAWPELPSRHARRCACAHCLTAANKLPRKHVEGRGCCCDPRLRSEAPPRVPYRRWRERASSYPGGVPPSLRPVLGAHGSDE